MTKLLATPILACFTVRKTLPIISGTLNCINPQSNGCVCDPRSGSGMQGGHSSAPEDAVPALWVTQQAVPWVGTTGMVRGIFCSQCCLLAKQSHQAVLKNTTCCALGNGSRDKGSSEQRPSAVPEPHFIKQGNLLSAYTGARVKVVPGLGNSQRARSRSCLCVILK